MLGQTLPLNIVKRNTLYLRSLTRQIQLLCLFFLQQLDLVAIKEVKLESDQDTVQALESFLPRYDVCIRHIVEVSAACWLLLKKSLNFSEFPYVVDNEESFISCDYFQPYQMRLGA